MIPWWWAAVAFFLGDMLGIIAMAICVGSTDKAEQRAEIKNRQRCNADGSKGGVL